MLTKAEADAIVIESKVITNNITWRSVPCSSRPRFQFETSVLVPTRNMLLKLYGRCGGSNYSFSLVCGGQPIRKLTKHARHRNPDQQFITGLHKHIWDEVNEDGYAYVPDDIHAEDVHQAFHDFLKECSIELRGAYKAFLV